MTADQVLEDCRKVKAAGTSSKVPVPISVLEQLCRDALAWQATPAYIREVSEAVRAQK